MDAYLLHHQDDLPWVRQGYGEKVDVLAHEDYLPVFLNANISCFFEYANDRIEQTDNAINFLSFNWYRDADGRGIPGGGDVLSVADAFSAGVIVNIASVCREYFALQYWLGCYERVFVSCNEPAAFLAIARKFAGRVEIFDPGHRNAVSLTSMANRVLVIQTIDRRAKVLRFLQSPFLRLFRGKTLALSDWTMSRFAARKAGWVSVNSRWPWKGAYGRTPPPRYFAEAQKNVPSNFDGLLCPERLAEVLLRTGVVWNNDLLALLSSHMRARYALYRDYFVSTVATYQDMLDSYAPSELVVGSEFYEPYLVAAHVAKSKGIKVSWLVDGYLIVDIEKRIGRHSVGPVMFDRVYAIACQHQRRILKNKPELQEVVTIFPPSLDSHVLNARAEKSFDAIIMTWIPNDLGMDGRNGSRPCTLLDALKVAMDAGLESLAIKIKHHTEKEWLLPILESAGYASKVTLLEGPFADHVKSARRVIGGVSSAVAESAYHDVPYYVYEPVANGYNAEQLASAVILVEGGVARTPLELRVLLKNPKGSVINNKQLLFGTECPHPEWTWDQTRELYTSWAADWADRSGIKSALQWRGFPLWWSTNLVAKDTAVDYAWYQALHERLRGLPAKQFTSRSHASVYAGLLKSLAKDVGKWLLLKLLPETKTEATAPAGNRVWFHSLEYNFINAREGFCDRMYEQAPLDDSKHGFKSAFIVRLNFKAADFLHPLLWRKKVGGLAQKLRREVAILDRYLQLGDVIQLHASLIGNYFRFTKIAGRLKQHGVRIGHAEFADILVSEMQKSFTGLLPWSLSYAAMFERWLQRGSDKTLVTYGETLAPMRAAYFATRKNSAGHRWVSIQHATIYRNKMGFYHRRSEFSRSGPDDKRSLSPMPDYYFVHGAQFADILAGFYPSERIRVTGCLKYDSLYRLYGQACAAPRREASERIMLLAPSVGDEEIILRIFAGLAAIPGWRVVLSKHPTVSQGWIDELIRRNAITLDIGFDPSKSTTQLMEAASLVVCSYSGIALESFFAGVPSVRVLNPQQPPMVEDEPGINYVTTQQAFLEAVRTLDLAVEQSSITPEAADTLQRYFYKFDGQASTRFWGELGRLDDLPGKRVAPV